MKILNIFGVIVTMILLITAFLDYRLDTKIMAANNVIKMGEMNTPLRIKGIVYYVTKEQSKSDEVYTSVFIACTILIFCLLFLKMRSNKIDWERYWEEHRGWMKNKK